jgi:hypothetical protein
MPNVTICFNLRRKTGLLTNVVTRGEAQRYLMNTLQSAITGGNQSDGLLYSVNDDTNIGGTAFAQVAGGALVASGAAGAVGGTICGTLITTATLGSDTLTMTALAAAINASTAVNRRVEATNLAARVTLASVLAGQYIDICNTRFTAQTAAVADFGQFVRGVSDTADAASLALAVNRHPAMALKYFALSVAGLVYVFPSTPRTLSPTVDKWAGIINSGSFTTFTVNSREMVAGAACAVLASTPGDIGNEARLTASGTGMTAATNGSAGFLGNGNGGGVSANFTLP